MKRMMICAGCGVAFAALALLGAAGCQINPGPDAGVATVVKMGAAYEKPRCAEHSMRIDLADQETEGFHFKVPADAITNGPITRWSVNLVNPPALEAADPQAAKVAMPANAEPTLAGPAQMSQNYFLTPHLYDCLTVDNPLAPATGSAGTPEHVPDVLLPMQMSNDGFASQLPAGDERASRHLWVELTWRLDASAIEANPARRLAGTQTIQITGYDAQGARRVAVALEAHFHQFSLPVTGRFRTLLNWNTTIAGYYGWKDVSPEMRRTYYDFFLQYRLSPTSLHNQAMEPSVEDLPFCAERGQNAVNLYTLERQKGPLPQEEIDAVKKIAAAAKPVLDQNNLQNSAFVLVCNAADESDIDSINANADAVHSELPWAKVWLFSSPCDALAQRINAWTTLTVADTGAFHAISFDATAREKFASPKDLTFWYVGQEPTAPHVNLLLSNRPLDAQVLPLQIWANNVNGLVIPHATAWPWAQAAAMNFPATEWRARRDGFGLLCYPLPDGRPCPSVRLTNLRDGLEHAEALRTADWLIYNLDIEQKLFDKITLPALNEQLKTFDNIGHTDDLRKRLVDKLTLTHNQMAAIPAALDHLRAVVEAYKAAFAAVDAQPAEKQADQLLHLRRRLYRAIDEADPLNQAIVKNINDPVVPAAENQPEAPAAPTAPDAPTAPTEPPAQG